MVFGDIMKKSENILEYVEKYKYKYGISYLDEKHKGVKKLTTAIRAFLIYMVVFLPIMMWSLLLNAQKIAHTTQNFSFASIHKTTYTFEFYVLLVSTLAFIFLLFVLKKSGLFSAIAVPILPLVVFCFGTCTENQNGFGYKPSFYFLLVPAIILGILVVVLLLILIRAQIKTNMLYNMLIEGIYRQYGNTDGVKMSEAEWNEFIKDYNPHRMITKENTNNSK